MAAFVYRRGDYKVMKCLDGYIVSNVKGERHNHGHFKKLDTCLVLIKLLEKKLVPKNPYLRRSAFRLSIDEDYKESVFSEMIKEK